MKRQYEIVNYANEQIFDLYEFNDKNQRYKRFRIGKSDLVSMLTSTEATQLNQGTLRFVTLNERVVEERAQIRF
jgi:hypothetical protein